MGKVLIYGLLDIEGGVEKFVLNLFFYGNKPSDKYGCLIIGSKAPYETKLIENNIDFAYIPKKRHILKNYFCLKKLLKAKRDEYDTIYFNTSGLYYPIPYLLAKKYKYRIVLHSHLATVNDLRKPIHLINRHFINKVAYKKLACSMPAAEWMFEKRYLSSVRIVPNAINVSRFAFDNIKRSEIRNRIGANDETIVIGNVARLFPIKNQSFAIDVLAEIVKEKKCILILVGEGPEKEKLKKYAEKKRVLDYVIFWGYVSNPEEIMNAFDCVVMPSFIEGFPISLIEQQAAGLECFVSDQIAHEVNVTGHVHFLPISLTSAWSNAILSSKLSRYDSLNLLKEKGYDLLNFEDTMWKLLNE